MSSENSLSPREALAAQVEDFRAEQQALYAIVNNQPDTFWQTPTTFKSWTPWDVIAHLHFSDEMGHASLKGADAFHAMINPIGARRMSMAAYTREWLGDCSVASLLDRWNARAQLLCDRLAEKDPEEKLAWAGPGMRPRMFATARQMETWAHGQEIYDLLGETRVDTDRLFNIATIGVRTYGWTFANRKLDPPGSPPAVTLTAPSGVVWRWNEDNTAASIEGSAVEFCQVVTQVRNIADTTLKVQGEPAVAWMQIAQCFAGGPEDPPAPGTRVIRK